MTAVVRSARGASAFTSTERSTFESLGETSPVYSPGQDVRKGWKQLIDELLRIRNLKDDWDGEGSEGPHPALVDGAITLAQYLEASDWSPADRVIASVNGTVYFEWHTPLGYCEIEVTSPLDAEYREVPNGADQAKVVLLHCR